MDGDRFGFDGRENIYFDRTRPISDGEELFEEAQTAEIVDAYRDSCARIATLEAEVDGLRYDAETARLIEGQRDLELYCSTLDGWVVSTQEEESVSQKLGEAVRAAVKGE